MITPVALSPASPAELLQYIVTYQTHPTTLIICTSRAEFLASLTQDVRSSLPRPGRLDGDEYAPEEAQPSPSPSPLLSAPLYQIAVARHIRILFVSTVTHLRTYLSVLDASDTKIPPPPVTSAPSKRRLPLLLAYGFLELHRDTSEWSAQGISNTAAALVDGAARNGFRAVVVEARGGESYRDFKTLLEDVAPVLSGGVRRDNGGWTGRTVEMKRVLCRWFRFQRGQWDAN